MGKVRSRSVDAVIVYRLDRLSRRVIDTLSLMELFERHHVAFHAIVDRIDTKSATGRFVLNIMASLAQMERDLISERTKDALKLKIVRNERAGQIPYGYRLGPDGVTLLPHRKEQAAIALIRSLRAQGESLRAICVQLEKAGYRPTGSKWHSKTVWSILKRAA